jgi:hypothetical protein
MRALFGLALVGCGTASSVTNETLGVNDAAPDVTAPDVAAPDVVTPIDAGPMPC